MPPEFIDRPVSATLDLGSKNCATLILSVRRAISEMQPGDILAVVAYDPSALLDLRAWCRMTGHQYLGTDERGVFSVHYLEV